MHSWIRTGTHCTTAMSDYVVAMMRSVSNAQAVVQLTGLSSEQLKEIQTVTKAAPSAVAGKGNEPSRTGKLAGSIVPGVEHPTWQSLIDGSKSLDCNNVALNMLLQRVRMNYDKSPNTETTKAGTIQLRQFFVRNERLLRQEITQVFDSQSAVDIEAGSGQSHTPQNDPVKRSAEGTTIPKLDDPVWQRIVKGDLVIQSDRVAFNMLLQRVRMSYDKSPGVESVVIGTKSLQQFFDRHQKFLRPEIDQLSNRRPDAVIEGKDTTDPIRDDSLPVESAVVWQQIVNGDRQLATNMVGLQMILERARKLMMQDSSEENRQACIRTLYDFFLKHKKRLSQEIAQLGDGMNNSSIRQ